MSCGRIELLLSIVMYKVSNSPVLCVDTEAVFCYI